jgi:undecaprenol kinase
LKNSPLRRRFGYAWAGVRAAWTSEHSLRTHAAAAAAVLVVMAWLRPGLIWWALVGGMITLILAMELLNTAIEQLADHLHPDEHPRIKLVKDCAAAAVLLLSIGAVWVGVLMLVAVYAAD